MLLKLFILMVTIAPIGLCAERTAQIEPSSLKIHKVDSKVPSPALLDITNEGSRKENLPAKPVVSKDIKGGTEDLSSQMTFPHHEIDDIYEAFGGGYEEGMWVLTTRTTMRQLAFCASKGDPVGALYLANAFNHTSPVCQSMCPLARRIYERAFASLEVVAFQTTDTLTAAKAKFLLAKEYFTPAYLNHAKYIPNKIDIALKHLENLTSREAILLTNIIRARHDINPTPSFEDFLNEEDLKIHPWGFLKALKLFPLNLKSTIETLETAIQKGNHPALLMHLEGYYREHYERTNDESSIVKCLSLLERAGALGHPLAYIEMGAFYVRFNSLSRSFNFTEATPSDSEKSRALHLPEASYNLGNHAYQEYRNVRGTDSGKGQEFLRQAIEYYKEAAKVGFWPVYGILDRFLPFDDPFFTEYPCLEKEKQNLFMKVMGF
jgi:hypothetical protein